MIREKQIAEPFNLTESRLCHIRKPGSWNSWCETAEFNPERVHSVAECVEHHTQCAVCLSMREAAWVI